MPARLDAGQIVESDVAASAEILVEQRIVAINVGLRSGRQLLAGGRGLDLGLRSLAVQLVELLTDRAAALSCRKGNGTWIAPARAATFGTAGQHR